MPLNSIDVLAARGDTHLTEISGIPSGMLPDSFPDEVVVAPHGLCLHCHTPHENGDRVSKRHTQTSNHTEPVTPTAVRPSADIEHCLNAIGIADRATRKEWVSR